MKHNMQTFTLDDVLAAAKEILAKQHIVRTTVDESGDYPSYQYEICEVWSYGPRTIGSADIPAYALLFAGSTMLASEVERLKSEVMAARADAEPQEEDFAPAVDPITGAPLFMWIDHPERGMVPTYGGPFDSYTLCERDIDESNSDEIRFYRERFDHDEGAWVEGCESVGFSLITQTRLISLEDSRGRAMSAFERLADEGTQR